MPPLDTKWSLTPLLPSANLVLIFDGMMALCERKNPAQYEFLCHGESEGTRSHDLEVKIDGKPLENANDFSQFEFYVLDKTDEKTTETNRIGAYTPNSSNEQAFSHLIDLEQIFGGELKKHNPLRFANQINIKNGVIHTSKLSEYEFSLVDVEGNEIMQPRQIATELSINISLADNEIGILKWYNDNQEPNFQQFDNQENHTIYFNNDCTDTSTPDGKCKDSDFWLNFENIIDDSEKRGCYLKQYINIMTAKEYPCASSGYGETDGWDT